MIFHRDAHGFPRSFTPPRGEFVTLPSRHANDRAAQKRFTIPDAIAMSHFDVIEVEIINGRTNKMVVRDRYNDRMDIVLVIIPQGRAMFIKTAWLNSKNDRHSTLDKSKYGRP